MLGVPWAWAAGSPDKPEGASSEAAQAWGRHPDHAHVQGRGREAYYESYTLFTADKPRMHHFERQPQ